MAKSEWQPIETAPKDGRWFMAGAETSYDIVGGHGWWVGTVRFEYPNDQYPEIMGYTGYDSGPVCVTHWQPLPPAPLTGGRENG